MDLNLGKGEAEVIALANETGLKTIIDDLKARSIAEKLALKVTGTIGILLKAESLGLLESAYKKAIELADQVVMIMPDTHRQHGSSFNSFIRKHTNKIGR